MNWKAVPSAGQCLVLLASAILGCQPADAQKPVETPGPYVHREAGAVFPLRVGEFQRSELYRYDEGGRDVSAAYNLATPEGRLLITVYIYPAAPAPPEARTEYCGREFDSVKAVIREQYEGSLIEEGRALAVPGSEAARRHRASYRLSMKFDRGVQAVRSEAHLYCYVGGNWFVKYRITAPIAVTAPGAVETFIRTGPWPGRPSSETIARMDPRSRRGTPYPTQR
jgi:hypothetical protein